MKFRGSHSLGKSVEWKRERMKSYEAGATEKKRPHSLGKSVEWKHVNYYDSHLSILHASTYCAK
jgi:hypothetical protein